VNSKKRDATPGDIFNKIGVFIHEFGLDGIIKIVNREK